MGVLLKKQCEHLIHIQNSTSDRALGLDRDITRRDFLNSTLLASGGFLLNATSPAQLLAQQGGNQSADDDWSGYGGVGDYAKSNGNTMAVLEAGHRIRNQEFESVPADIVETGEIYDCVVVGGGISGLAAALIFQQLAGKGKNCLVIDNHPIFGGEAKRNEFRVDGHRLIAHQGSAFFPVPYPHSFIRRFYDSIGLKTPRLDYQKWAGPDPEMKLSTTPYLGSAPNGTYFGTKFGKPEGTWVFGEKVWEQAPISAKAREELTKYDFSGDSDRQVPRYPGDAISRRLDSITLEDYMMERGGISRETIREFLCPGEGGGYGLGPDALSGYTAYAADMLHPLDISDETGQQMFPGGNGGIARLITKTLIPEAIAGDHSLDDVCRKPVNFAALDRAGAPARIRLDSTAVWVKHEGDPVTSDLVTIAYTHGGKTYRVRARSVVMAGGSWTTKHIVRDLPSDLAEAYAQFYRAPCLMANVAVRNWRFLYKMGISGCRWYGALGEYTASAQAGIVRRRLAHHRPRLPCRADDQDFICLSRQTHGAAGSHGTRAVIVCSIPRLRAPDSAAVHGYVFALRIRCQQGHSWHHPEPLGTRVFDPTSGIFLRAGRQARARRCGARGAVRPNCIRQYRFVGSGRSSIFDHRSQSCSRATTRSGSELSLTPTCLCRACLPQS
jgi:spermidine dehydrogenase